MRNLILIAVATLTATTAAAQQHRLSLQACIDLAQEQNATLRTGQKQVEQAHALQGTAWNLDKTELSISQDPTAGGSPDNAMAVTQRIDFPTVYLARSRQLKAETQAQRSQLDVVRKEVEADVASAYYQLVFREQCLRDLRRQDSILTRYHAVVSRRLEAGETGRRELLNAERLQRESRLDIAQAQSEAEAARLQLMLLLGTDESVAPADDTLAAVRCSAPLFNYRQSPEGRLASDRLEAAARQVSVEKGGYAPTLSLSLRHQMVISAWNPYHQDRSRFDGGNFMGFEVGVGIPLFYGATKARVKAAKAEREQLQLQAGEEARRRETQYHTLLAQCQTARQRMEYYTKDGRQWNDEIVRLATAEYEQGEIGYVEFVGILRDAMVARQQCAAAINDYNQTVIRLQRLCGK